MAKKAKTKKAKVSIPVITPPKNLSEVNEMLERIAALERGNTQAVSALSEEIANLRKSVVERVDLRVSEIRGLVLAVHVYAKAERKSLTADGKKTVALPAGSIGWRMTPPAVTIKNAEQVLHQIKSLGLEKFIRTKETIDKEAMLKDKDEAASIKGVKIRQQEEFVVKIDKPDLEITDPPRKKKGKKKEEEGDMEDED